MAKSQRSDNARLAGAVRDAHKNMQPYRENRMDAVRAGIGIHYADRESGSWKPVLLNLIGMYTSVVGRALISKDPRVMLSTHRERDKPAVRLMQDWANKELEDMRFADPTLSRIVLDGLYGPIGIAKVALSDPGDSARTGWQRPAGSAFVDRVDFDDFVVDLYARDFRAPSFIGHRFCLPLEIAKKRYKSKKLEPSDRKRHNTGGDDKLSTLGEGDSSAEEYYDYVDLWEIYCPLKRTIHVFQDDFDETDDQPLQVREWLGPPSGPYHILGFNHVPGNLMPKGPVMDLVDMHVSINGILNKLVEQAQRQKSVLPYAGAEANDVALLNSSKDGHGFKVTGNPADLREVRFGGPDAANFNLMMALKEIADWSAGNISIMGGLAPQSKTAAQDKMLNENSTRMLSDMGGTTVRFVSDVCEALCWYWWHDPYKVMRAEWSPPGAPRMSVNRELGPLQRMQVPWDDLRMRIDPYSMTHKTPEARLNFLNAVVRNLGPMMPLFAQMGVMFDPQAYIEQIAEFGDEPEVPRLFRIQQPLTQDAETGLGHGKTLPSDTTRSYERRSLGGDTPNNRLAEIGNEMSAAAAEGSEGY